MGSSGYSANAYASGSSGGLIGVDATIATASDTGTTKGYVVDGTTLNVTGATTVAATTVTSQGAEASSNTGGLVAAGASTAHATSSTDTEAYLGTNVKLTGGSLAVAATGTDTDYADATAGSAGAIAASAAVAGTTNTSTTTAKIKDGTASRPIDLSTRGGGTLLISAEHTAASNSHVASLAGGAIAGTGVDMDNAITAWVEAGVGSGVTVSAKDLTIQAISHVRKPLLSGSNISGTAGGAISGGGQRHDHQPDHPGDDRQRGLPAGGRQHGRAGRLHTAIAQRHRRQG